MPKSPAPESLGKLAERSAFRHRICAVRNLFKQLRTLRPWGPEDRIPPETIAFWEEEAQRNPGRPVRTEVELWYHDDQTRRRQASNSLQNIVREAGGSVVHEAIVGDIAYHGMLVDLPAGEIQNLIAHRRLVRLAIADEIMFLRPQSMLSDPLELDPSEAATPGESTPAAGAPIAALLDGVPVQAHRLLDGRLLLDDPDDLQARTLVRKRIHGTAMASLILHGDRNENQAPLSRPLYVRPVMMIADGQEREHTDADRLLVDTIYRAILRIKGSAGEEAAAPSVFLINLSMGDPRRPFTGVASPLARLLDFLSSRYNVLFLVSGGNVTAPLTILGYTTWTEFEDAVPEVRERAVLEALNQAIHERTILSPAESLNALTIGAQHHDSVTQRQGTINAADPLTDHRLPNVSSGLGLGHRRGIKPDLYFPGGREYVRLQSTGDRLVVTPSKPRKLFGLGAAAPDPSEFGRLDQIAFSDGTSSATGTCDSRRPSSI
jgi:Subtilase family